MSTEQQPVSSLPDRVPTTLHVNVVDDHTVEVSGVAPQEMIDLLQAGPDHVVVDGQDHDSQLNDLSDREIEVLRLIGSGADNHEVADRMYLSINTVKSYIRSAYRKIGAGSRSQAIIWSIDHGIVPAHPNDQN